MRKVIEAPISRRNIVKKNIKKYAILICKRDKLKDILFSNFDIYNGEKIKGKKYKKMRSRALNIHNRKLRTLYIIYFGHCISLQNLTYGFEIK